MRRRRHLHLVGGSSSTPQASEEELAEYARYFADLLRLSFLPGEEAEQWRRAILAGLLGVWHQRRKVPTAELRAYRRIADELLDKLGV